MKKRLITLLIPLLLLSLAFIPQTAQAKPDSIDCIHNPVCLGSTYWNGANYGGFTTVTISVPGMRTSPAYWQRFFRVSGNVTSDYPRIEVGESVTSGSGFGTYCAGAGAGRHYFIYTWDVFHDNTFNYCASIPSADGNQLAVYRVNSASANCNNGTYVQIITPNFGHNECLNWNTYGLTNQPHRLGMVEQVADLVTGHEVWGSQWTANGYIDASGTFNSQQRAVDSITQHAPQLMMWHTIPAPFNGGGNLYSCVYETGSSCTPGS